MKKIGILTIVPLMLLSSLFLVPINAHGQFTGQVNINGGTEVVATASQTTVSVTVQISGSDALNGFDVQVKTDNSILVPTSVSLGSVLSSATIVVECINGVLVTGSSCSPQDGLGVAHLAAAHVGSLTAAPTSGVLFTINYNIVGSTTGSPISFNTGCSGTSVSGDCVTISNGTPTPNPETDLGATFANLVDFSMTPAFTSISTPATVAINDVINYASEGGFSDILSETVATSSGLTCTLAANLVDLTVPAGSDTLTCSAAANGSYSVTVTATGLVTSTTHSATIAVLVAPAGFSLTLSQSSVQISRGTSDSSTTISLAGVSSFSGTVSFTAANGGITGSAPMATLTPDGSGFSSATSTLTISVASSVATGSYALTVNGMSGASTASASITVVVPGFDFSFVTVPNAETIVRGGSAVATLNLASLGSFAGTVTLSAVVTNINTDSCCSTTNIVSGFSTTLPVLTAGGTAQVAFTASTIGGTAPPSTFTATGNYTVAITATSGSISHTVVIAFNVQDFVLGPAFCTGTNLVFGTPDGNQYPVPTGTVCTGLTITNQFLPLHADNPGGQVLWVQTNVLSGLQTNGFNGTPAIASVNTDVPAQGVFVPSLNAKFCLVPTYFANGTQIPYSYLEAHGPIIVPGQGLYVALGLGAALGNWGCKFDAGAFPNDQGIPALNAFFLANFGFNPNFPLYNNPDFLAVTAQTTNSTAAGTYMFKLCGQLGVLLHCNMYTLNVINAPSVHQFVAKTSYSFAATGGLVTFKLGVGNNDVNTIYAQVTAIGTGSAGDTFTATTGVVKIAPGAAANNLSLSTQLTAAEIGESFTFTVSISVGTDPTNLDGTSTLLSISRTFVLNK